MDKDDRLPPLHQRPPPWGEGGQLLLPVQVSPRCLEEQQQCHGSKCVIGSRNWIRKKFALALVYTLQHKYVLVLPPWLPPPLRVTLAPPHQFCSEVAVGGQGLSELPQPEQPYPKRLVIIRSARGTASDELPQPSWGRGGGRWALQEAGSERGANSGNSCTDGALLAAPDGEHLEHINWHSQVFARGRVLE